MQKVNISQENALCIICGANILDIANFKYTGKTINGTTFSEELCFCRHCKNSFIIRYDFFDKDNHINPLIFNEDINNPDYNWQDNLTEDQKRIIGEHLKNCDVCKNRLSEEMLSDAWLASFIHGGKNANKNQ